MRPLPPSEVGRVSPNPPIPSALCPQITRMNTDKMPSHSDSVIREYPHYQRKTFRLQSQRGSITLVALCFVTVMAIGLASYLAVSGQSMKLSNRSYAKDVSKNLAEKGLEVALQALRTNNWDDLNNDLTANYPKINWELSGTTATGTITYAANSYGTSGMTATTKIRVDNYNAYNQPATWNATTNYQLNDVVGADLNSDNISDMWFRCIVANTNQTPTATGPFTHWVPAPIPWTWSGDITYSLYDVVNYNGTWYRYSIDTPSSGTVPDSSSRWTVIPSISLSWTQDTQYEPNAIVYSGGSWYSCLTSHNSGTSFDPTLWDTSTWSSTTAYTVGSIAYHNGSWYSCILAHTNQQPTPTPTTYWISANWVTATNYKTGYIIYANGSWYRCKTDHTSGVFSNDLTALYWQSAIWTSGTTYAANDIVNYNGSWYTCILAPTANQAPTNTTYWTLTNQTNFISWQYLPEKHEFNDVVFYPNASNVGTWYRNKYSLGGPTGTSGYVPTNTTYWENALSTTWTWTSGDKYNPGDAVYRSNSFYRCIRAHDSSSNLGRPPNTTYWSADPLFTPAWDPGKQYSIDDSSLDTGNDLVFYNGNWFLYIHSAPSIGKVPSLEKDYWAVAPRTITAWDSTKLYSVDDLVSSGGTWYRCIQNHTNQNTTTAIDYWQPMTGATGSYAPWNASTTYTPGNYVSYGGVWYKCHTAPTAKQSPNDSGFWSASCTNSYGVTTGAPVIYSEGTTSIPLSVASGSLQRAEVKTQLRATTSPAALLPNAVATTDTLTIGGAGTVDSYDGSVTSIDSRGHYEVYDWDQNDAPFTPTNKNNSFAATLASSFSGGTAINGGTGTIQGYLAAPADTITYAPWQSFAGTLKGTSTGSGIDLKRITRSPFIPQFDIFSSIVQTALPATTPYTTLNLGTPGSPVPTYYSEGTLLIGTTININGPVILRMTGNLRITTGEIINIYAPGSLLVTMPLSTNGRLMVDALSYGFKNWTKDPRKLIILSDTTSTGTQYYNDTDNPFYGVIYLPNIAATDGITIADNVTIYGAISANKVRFMGAANVHYDTSLRYATFPGIDTPFQLDQWRELTDPAERAVLP